MSSASNDQGRAYEYAWINVLFKRVESIKRVRIIDNSSFQANKRSWNLMSKEQQTLFIKSAEAAVEAIIEMEPILIEVSDDEVSLEFQRDDLGKIGDVRDIVVKRESISWEIGLSVKHNHDAIKHSRLSNKLDFGSSWYKIPCSRSYWNAIRPVFDMLETEKVKGTKWSELPNKEEDVYKPLLIAFMKEVSRAYKKDNSVARKMVEYLIGICDYYKVISVDSKRLTLIHTFNLHGTLNRPSRERHSDICVPIVDLPTEIVNIRFKTRSSNTVELYLNNGWELSFRIHNAATLVEPSLKFDIQFVGMPLSVFSIECKWR